MHDARILIPILVSLGLFALIFGIVYLRNKENMAMIERNINPRSYKPQSGRYQSLKWGLLFVGSGFGLLVAFLFDKLAFNNADDIEALYFSLIALFGGLGLMASYLIEKKDEEREVSSKNAPAYFAGSQHE